MKTETKKVGARKGSGRKPKDPTEIINFRVPKGKGAELKPLMSAYLKSLLNPGGEITLQPGTFATIEDKEKFKSDFKELTKSAPIIKLKSASSEPTMAELFKQMIAEK